MPLFSKSPADAHPQLSAINRIVTKVQRRQRSLRILRYSMQVSLPLGLVLGALILIFVRLGGYSTHWIWLAVLPALLICAIAWLRPLARRRSIRLIDECYQLHDLIGNTVELSSLQATSATTSPKKNPSDLDNSDTIDRMIAAVDKATPNLHAKEVVPMTMPSLRKIDVLGLILFAVATQLPASSSQSGAELDSGPGSGLGPDSKSEHARALEHKPISSARDQSTNSAPELPFSKLIDQELRELSQYEDSFANEVLDILKELESQDISLAQALEQLEELSQKLESHLDQLDQELEEDPQFINEALQDLSETWRSYPKFSDAARSLANREPESGLDALGRAIADGNSSEEAKRALAAGESSLQRSIQRNLSTAKQIAEAERRIRRSKPKSGESSEDYQRRLKRQQDTLDRLKRQHKREQAARQELEKLRRLSRQSRKQGSRSKQEQREFSESMKKLIRRHQKPKQQRRVKEIIEETKAIIRRAAGQDKGKNRRKQQRKRFDRMASGKKDPSDQTTHYVESELQNPPNNGSQLDDLQTGGDSDTRQTSDEAGQKSRESDGQNSGPEQGIGIGSEDHERNARRKPFPTRSKRLSGRTSKGASRAEIIETSSQSGFANESYRNVYQDYRSFAQSVMDRENLPESRRGLVHRYFRLISPRQDSSHQDEQP